MVGVQERDRNCPCPDTKSSPDGKCPPLDTAVDFSPTNLNSSNMPVAGTSAAHYSTAEEAQEHADGELEATTMKLQLSVLQIEMHGETKAPAEAKRKQEEEAAKKQATAEAKPASTSNNEKALLKAAKMGGTNMVTSILKGWHQP